MLAASSSPKRKIGLARPSSVSSGRNELMPCPRPSGCASASSIGSSSSSGVPRYDSGLNSSPAMNRTPPPFSVTNSTRFCICEWLKKLVSASPKSTTS